ncbi:RagB/SusD family nutrient uptake outer membrane protein [Pedobacter miscanthi]|uniref:RagB/SusD domain-containing protein n=1 Tax=Pedobacter miscanthi TaxID=2259170 RepID=A0A366L258_9SPHI|nr:RagB/SusD family nutrient uptake outer membrane protein [Pedobacter miscanthi]RBQ07870.1 hypothetical protein DRW42_09720 [Pedobacter miscanthi]
MKTNKILFLVVAFIILASFSCKKFMTVEPGDAVLKSNSMKNSTDAINVINGLYSLMQPLVDQMYLAGEAQADLVVAARGADKYVREIAENRVTASNPYTDYSKFYRLIIACNQAINDFGEVAKIDPVYNTNVYSLNIAEVTYIRAWTYLQLVKIWGDVPYIEEGVIDATQIKSVAKMNGDDIMRKVAAQCEANLSKMQLLSQETGYGGGDQANLAGQFNQRNSRILLAELYVYAGNYNQAWITIQPYYSGADLANPTRTTAIESAPFNMFAGQWQNWHQAFDRVDVNVYGRMVGLTINFDGSRNQFNSLIKWTGNKNGAVYALKPSTNAIEGWKRAPSILQTYQNTQAGYFINPSYTFGNGPQDAVNADGSLIIGGYGDYIRGAGGSYFVSGQDTLIFKFLTKNRVNGVSTMKDLLINDAYSNNDMYYILYRDGTLCLLISEILNNIGLPSQALLNFNGFANYAYVAKGTRYRVGVYPLSLDPKGGDMVKQVDRLILDEGALELAFEGRRWFDLVRFAKRSTDPDFLGKLVARKYPEGMRASIIAKYRNPASWYFPVYNAGINQ